MPMLIAFGIRHPESLVCVGLPVFLLLLHYLLWGRALAREVAGERQEALRDQYGPSIDWPAIGTGIPEQAKFLPPGEKRTETGI
jgi:hypothetical protein